MKIQLPYNHKYSFEFLDVVLLILMVTGIVFFFMEMNRTLDYKWEWSVIPTYLIKINPDSGALSANILLKGFFTTIRLSIWSMIVALFLGVLSGFMRARGKAGQQFLSWIYVETIRNIPSLILMFIFYFFVSSQFLDVLHIDRWLRDSSPHTKEIIGFLFADESSINNFISAVITLGIYEGAYVSEIIRGGITGIPGGQWEAAYSVGLSPKKAFFLVILPQTVRRIASPLAGQFISTIKDSAIVSIISIQELTFQGMEVMAATYLTFEVWITVTFLYFTPTFSLSRLVAFMEIKFKIRS